MSLSPTQPETAIPAIVSNAILDYAESVSELGALRAEKAVIQGEANAINERAQNNAVAIDRAKGRIENAESVLAKTVSADDPVGKVFFTDETKTAVVLTVFGADGKPVTHVAEVSQLPAERLPVPIEPAPEPPAPAVEDSTAEPAAPAEPEAVVTE